MVIEISSRKLDEKKNVSFFVLSIMTGGKAAAKILKIQNFPSLSSLHTSLAV